MGRGRNINKNESMDGGRGRGRHGYLYTPGGHRETRILFMRGG